MKAFFAVVTLTLALAGLQAQDKPKPPYPVAVCTTDLDCARWEAAQKAKKAMHQCAGTTKAGKQCRRNIREGQALCWQHAKQASK